LGVTINGGVENVAFSGGTALASGTIINSGGALNVSSGGIASAATVGSSGHEVVLSGGTMAGAVLSGGGELTLDASALISGGVVFAGSAGSVNILQISGATIPSGLVLSSFVSGDIIDLASVALDSGGTTLVSGSTLTVVENGQSYTL